MLTTDEFKRFIKLMTEGKVLTNMEIQPNISILLYNKAMELRDKAIKLEKLSEELKNTSESSNKILLDIFRELDLEDIC